MKRIALVLTLWVGALVAHAEMDQSNPSMPGQQINPGIIGNGANPGLAPLPDAPKGPGLNNNEDDNANDDEDPYNNDPNSINNEPGSEGDLDSGDTTTPTAQGS